MFHDLFLALAGHPNDQFSFLKDDKTGDIEPEISKQLESTLSIVDSTLICEVLTFGIYARNIRPFASKQPHLDSVFASAFSESLSEVVEDYFRELEVLENDFLCDQNLGVLHLITRLNPYKDQLAAFSFLVSKFMNANYLSSHHLLDVINNHIPVICLPHHQPYLRCYHQLLTVLYKFIFNWILEGQLIDPHSDFFVVQKDSTFDLEVQKVPQLLSSSIAWKIVKLGSRVHKIRGSETAHQLLKDYRALFLPKCQDLIAKSVKFAQHDSENYDLMSYYESTCNLKPLNELVVNMDEYLSNKAWTLFSYDTRIPKVFSLLNQVALLSRGDIYPHFSLKMHQAEKNFVSEFSPHSDTSVPRLQQPLPAEKDELMDLQLDLQMSFASALDNLIGPNTSESFSLKFSGNGKTAFDCIQLEITSFEEELVSPETFATYTKFFSFFFLLRKFEFDLQSRHVALSLIKHETEDLENILELAAMLQFVKQSLDYFHVSAI
ncbi:Gamma-tubulin complex component 4 [Cichlidogyrus casuarinus]|uniref:Gamma-tubulin complex component n=1 Tax=Cichlidogyrus casuarinus TaxID=1844966 RepID=A0ABD2Q621_9PLAT